MRYSDFPTELSRPVLAYQYMIRNSELGDLLSHHFLYVRCDFLPLMLGMILESYEGVDAFTFDLVRRANYRCFRYILVLILQKLPVG